MRRMLLVFLSSLGIATALGLAWYAQTADAKGRMRHTHHLAALAPDGGEVELDEVMPAHHFEGY